jgi:hypothetical protein
MPSSRVSFYPPDESVEASHELSLDMVGQLWYQKEELQEIQVRNDVLVGQCVSGSGELEETTDCRRGLENSIRDRMSEEAHERRREHVKYVQGLLQLQSQHRQRQPGLRDSDKEAEELRKYSCKQSKQNTSIAVSLATRDATSCARICDKDDDDWKLPLCQQQQQQQHKSLPTISTKPHLSLRTNLRRSEGHTRGLKQILLQRETIHRSDGILQARRHLLIRPGGTTLS